MATSGGGCGRAQIYVTHLTKFEGATLYKCVGFLYFGGGGGGVLLGGGGGGGGEEVG